ERVQVGEDQVAQLGRLVRVHREADLERHLRERLGETRIRRKGVGRIDAAYEGDRHEAGAHALDEVEHVGGACDGVECRRGFRRTEIPPPSRKSAPNETMIFASWNERRGHATPYAVRFASMAALSDSKSTLRCGRMPKPASHASRNEGKLPVSCWFRNTAFGA